MCINNITTKDGQKYACGRCEQCHNRYIQHWTFRLQHEMSITNKAVFLTLTYDYSHIPMFKGKFTLDKEGATSTHKQQNPKPIKIRKDGKSPIFSSDYQNYIKRLRKALPDRKIKYVCAGEYGTKNSRPHYHLLLFGVDIEDFNILQNSWGMGSIFVGNVQPASIAYVFKYSVKGSQKALDWRQQKQFVAMSKGLGEDFAFNITYQKNAYINKKGNVIMRNKKIRHIKPHFQKKLNSLLSMPYYNVPKTAQSGTVRMSIPRFYLDAANYDKTELTEVYLDKIQTKYDHIPLEKREVILLKEQIQRSESPRVWASKIAHTISKEKI